MTVMGDYTVDSMKDCIKLKLSGNDLNKIWKRCGLTADFSANYVSTYFTDKKEIENSVSTILNELIENAAKYSKDGMEDIDIGIAVRNDAIVFQVDNCVGSEKFYRFHDFVSQILESGDVNAMYIDKLKTLNDDGKNKSGIGLLSIMSFFNIKFGLKFQNVDDSNNYRVSVQAAMPVGR